MKPCIRLTLHAKLKMNSLFCGSDSTQSRVITLPKPAQQNENLNWQPTTDRDSYNSAIEQIRNYIAEGRTYQVNYTMRLQTDFTGDAWDFFLRLAQGQNNYAAYVDTGRYAICSASPELFIQLDGESITCRPMKGTVKRGDPPKTTGNHSGCRNSKNRAENVMIVDMVRNDWGASPKFGSVHVPELFSLECFPPSGK
jgi:para-aminobenzoate synthetase/4-amino-4-deoxychorismate lyase